MARGWESKSVEDQQAAIAERRPPLDLSASVQQQETSRKLDGLLLQRVRVQRDLSTCTSDRYRATLESGLAYLEEQLIALGWERGEA